MVKPEYTHILDTFSEGASSAMQLARRCQNTLTNWTHFQKGPHQPSSLPEDARTHSHTGHIFRRGLISHPACQKMPEHTHMLDTFSEGASSAMQLARRRRHSLSGHIFRRSLISHPACQNMPEHTHSLDTFSYQPFSLPEDARTHSLPGHISQYFVSYMACKS